MMGAGFNMMGSSFGGWGGSGLLGGISMAFMGIIPLFPVPWLYNIAGLVIFPFSLPTTPAMIFMPRRICR